MAFEKLFNPSEVAVIGASRHEGKTGHEIFDNLLHDFDGSVYPVNPEADEVEGREALDEVKKGTDLAVVVVPADIVPNILKDCGDKNVGAAIVISAGFSETGNEELESEVRYIAEENDIDLLGPNVLGLINTENSMNASFASKIPDKGDISFMSQSGAFCTAILDYAEAENIGFHNFISLGNKADINEVDLLKKWREDDTEVILGYTEGIEDGREFMEEARKTSKEKPIILVKSGRTESGGEAASSHTGSIAGNMDAYRAAFHQTGIIEAESSRELLQYGRNFSNQPLPKGEKVAVVTNAGGPGVITSDEISERGLKLAELSDETLENLKQSMPDEFTATNPVDVIGDAGHRRYEKAIETVAKDEEVDSVIVLLTPQANTEIEKTAKVIANAAEKTHKPVMPCFMGEKDVEKGINILSKKDLPVFEDPKDAVKTLKVMNKYRVFLETEEEFDEPEVDEEDITGILEGLERFEDQKRLLEQYGLNVSMTEIAEGPQDAVEKASNMGYPVVLKINSPDINHKSDVGGVKTGLESRKEVEAAFNEIIDNVYRERPDAEIRGLKVQEQMDGVEVALGVKDDPQFGPVIMVGLGGIYVEALKDVSFGIPPISGQQAEHMIETLQSHEIFEGMRGNQEIKEPVKEAIVALGILALDNYKKISSLEINPLIVTEKDAYVSDINLALKEE